MAKSSKQTLREVHTATRMSTFIRVAVLSMLTTFGCLSLIAFTVTQWLENHILDTNTWVATVAPLPQTPVVNSALSTYITGLVFENVNVQQEIQNALPPKASFVAGPLADQLHTITTNATKRVLQGDTFQTVWTGANRFAMNRLLMNARSPNKPQNGARIDQFSLDLTGVKDKLANRLGQTASALPSLSTDSGQSFRIGANLQENRKRLWQYIRAADFLQVVLPFAVTAAFLGALAVSLDRRKTLLIIASISIIALLVELIAVKAARQSILDKVAHQEYRDAVGFVYDSLISPLRSVVLWFLVSGVLIVLICLATGPARWAASLRRPLTQRLSFLQIPAQYWHVFRQLVRRYQFYAWGGIGVLLLVWLAFISAVSARTVLRDILFAVSLAELVFIVSRPRSIGRL